MEISMEDVKYIAKLAKLRFSDEEALKLAEEFKDILTYFESIDKMDIDSVQSNEFSEDQKSVTRTDISTCFDGKTKLFRNTSSMHETYVKVPKIIE